ncbi:MAG TPA: NUDIX hydrolase [Acidimicrobiales bacterium]|nr:NUDIX hydrolase [Acidimicrobiales bacterium]
MTAAGRPESNKGFSHLGDELQLEGWRITLVQGTYEAPDGTVFRRQVVRHPGAVAVVPLSDHGTVLLVRQYRPAVDRWLLEIPAGTRDVEGEEPAVTARRELAEEMGLSAAHLEQLAVVHNTPGFCDEETVLYLATGLSPTAVDRHGPEEEHIEVVEVAVSELDDLMASGALTDAQTVLGLLMVRARTG